MKGYRYVVLMTLSFLGCALAGCGNDTSAMSDGSGNTSQASACVGSMIGATVTSSIDNCPGCSVSDAARSADGDRSSFSGLAFSTTGGVTTLRATAQPGVVFPAGQSAGALMYVPLANNGAYLDISVTFNTYLGGELQESQSVTSTTIGNLDGAGEDHLYSAGTNKPFDAVELEMSARGQPATVKVYELCSRT